jgi:hypothetical protein
MMRHGWPIVFLIPLSFALMACGTDKKKEDGPPRWSSFPVTLYTDPSLVPENDPDAKADFQSAMSFWEIKVGKKLFNYRGSSSRQAYSGDSISENSLFLQNPWSYAQNIAAQTIVISQKSEIRGAVIMVNPSTSFCNGDCTNDNMRTSMRKVFAHELGHFIGLGHSGDTANIMYPDALPGGSLEHLQVNAAELMPLIN